MASAIPVHVCLRKSDVPIAPTRRSGAYCASGPTFRRLSDVPAPIYPTFRRLSDVPAPIPAPAWPTFPRRAPGDVQGVITPWRRRTGAKTSVGRSVGATHRNIGLATERQACCNSFRARVPFASVGRMHGVR